MDDNGNIFHDDIFIKLEESKIIFADFVDDFYHSEFYTYNIDKLFQITKENMTKKEVFKKLVRHIVCHILMPQYRYKNYIFVLCLEEKTDENIKMLDIEIKLGWHGDHIRARPLFQSLRDEIENIYEDDDFLYTNNNVKLVIMAQEVSSLEKHKHNKKINKNKTYKIKECVICLVNSPNVLFCNYGHICLCEKCSEIECFDTSPICKTENTILRIIE